MKFDWHEHHRADPVQWFDWMRKHGEKLAGKTEEHCLAYARAHIGANANWHVAKIAASARELCMAKEWAECGFPQIVVADKLFASLAATNIPQEAIPEIGLPWPCFIVRLPDSMMPVVNWGNGNILPAVYMSVRQMVGAANAYCWELKTSDLPGAAMAISFRSISELLDPVLEDQEHHSSADWNVSGGLSEVDSDDGRGAGRVSLALRRAFVGALIELSNSTNSVDLRSKPNGKRDARGIPKAWTFQLTRAVKVDCRERVREIIEGRSHKKLSVQVLVRGHWKNQPCGTGAKERKFIHIEPYWRGPEDAPIAVRPHLLKN